MQSSVPVIIRSYGVAVIHSPGLYIGTGLKNLSLIPCNSSRPFFFALLSFFISLTP